MALMSDSSKQARVFLNKSYRLFYSEDQLAVGALPCHFVEFNHGTKSFPQNTQLHVDI